MNMHNVLGHMIELGIHVPKRFLIHYISQMPPQIYGFKNILHKEQCSLKKLSITCILEEGEPVSTLIFKMSKVKNLVHNLGPHEVDHIYP